MSEEKEMEKESRELEKVDGRKEYSCYWEGALKLAQANSHYRPEGILAQNMAAGTSRQPRRVWLSSHTDYIGTCTSNRMEDILIPRPGSRNWLLWHMQQIISKLEDQKESSSDSLSNLSFVVSTSAFFSLNPPLLTLNLASEWPNDAFSLLKLRRWIQPRLKGVLSTLKKLKPKLGKGLFQGKIGKDMLDLGMFYFKTVSKHPAIQETQDIA